MPVASSFASSVETISPRTSFSSSSSENFFPKNLRDALYDEHLDDPEMNRNIHDVACNQDNAGNSIHSGEGRRRSSTLRHANSRRFSGAMQCNVEMLVIILKDKESWADLQKSLRDGHHGIGCTDMSLRHNISRLLKDQYRQTVERQRERKVPSAWYKESPRNIADDESTTETVSNSTLNSDDWGILSDEEDSGEFLMGGSRGQGLMTLSNDSGDSHTSQPMQTLLKPISYKDIDLLQHQRVDILPAGMPEHHPEAVAVHIS